jgi:hypothetical protein
MVVKPIVSSKEAHRVKALYTNIKGEIYRLELSAINLKVQVFELLQEPNYLHILKKKDTKELVDDLSAISLKNEKTIRNLLNEVLVLLAIGSYPGAMSQASIMVLKGGVGEENWRAVYNDALDLVDGDVKKITAKIMKQAVKDFQFGLEEPDESYDDDAEEEEADQTNEDSFDYDDEEMEPPATRGRQKVIEKPLVKKAKSDDSKDRIKPSAIKAKLKNNIGQLKTFAGKLQDVVEKLERLAS